MAQAVRKAPWVKFAPYVGGPKQAGTFLWCEHCGARQYYQDLGDERAALQVGRDLLKFHSRHQRCINRHCDGNVDAYCYRATKICVCEVCKAGAGEDVIFRLCPKHFQEGVARHVRYHHVQPVWRKIS
jgi:hypothetical protein